MKISKLKNSVVIVFTLISIGRLSYVSGQNPQRTDVNEKFIAAISNYREAPNSSKETIYLNFINENPEYLYCYALLTEYYILSGNTGLGIKFFNSLINDPGTVIGASWSLARLHWYNEEYQLAEKYCLQLIQFGLKNYNIYEDLILISDNVNSGKNKIKDAMLRLSENDSALKIMLLNKEKKTSQAIKILNETPTENLSLNEIIVLVRLYEIENNLKKMTELIQFTLSNYRSQLNINDRLFLNRCQFGYEYQKYNFDKARKILESSMQLALQVDDSLEIARINLRKALVDLSQDDIVQTKELLENAIRIFMKARDQESLSRCYFSLSNYYYKVNDYDGAFRALFKAKNNIHLQSDKAVLFRYIMWEGTLLSELKQFYKAKYLFDFALKNVPSSNIGYYKYYVLTKKGTNKLHQQQFSEARTNFQLAINAFPHYKFESYSRIARTYFKEKSYQKADAYYRKAMVAAEDNQSANFLIPWITLRQGEVELELGNLKVAEQKIKQAIQYAEKENDDHLRWEAYYALARYLVKTNQIPSAINNLNNAVTFIERSRNRLNVDALRVGYFTEAHGVYQLLAACYARLDDTQKLFSTMQLTHGRGLSEASLQHQDVARILHDTTLAKSYLSLRDSIAAKQRRLRLQALNLHFEADTSTFLQDLQQQKVLFLIEKMRLLQATESDSLHTPNANFSLRDLQHKLAQNNSAVVQFQLGETFSFAQVITADSSLIVKLPAVLEAVRAQIHELLLPFHNLSGESIGQTVFSAKVAYSLYRQLWQPIEQTVVLPEKIIIIPDHYLTNLPFEMLLTEAPTRERYTPKDNADYAVNFLLNNYKISYSPNNNFLLADYPPVEAENDILILANPTTQTGNDVNDLVATTRFSTPHNWLFFPLPNGVREAEQIENLSLTSTSFLREQATEAAFRKHYKNYRVLHFATHAFADTSFAEFSGLAMALSADTTDDGVLMGYEFKELGLNAEIVTLGACETGKGKNVLGEGVLGLPRLVLTAGSRAVLQTMWSIPDNSTSDLMPMFYKNYFSGKMDKAESLTAAKKQLMQQRAEFAHPVYWAAFTLYGQTNPIKKYHVSSNLIGINFILGCLALVSALFIFSYRRWQKTSLVKNHN